MSMRRTARIFLLLALPLLLIGCRSGPSPETVSTADADEPTPLILISIDGLRWDYLDLHEAPTLTQLAEQGTHVERLIPVFPTKTFPNHYSIVTGLYPENHGIVSNTMYDPEMEASFSLGNQEAITNERWWEGEPIWVTAEVQGRTAATYFWPGSEAPIKGVRPSYWLEYDGSVPGSERVDQVLEWIDLPADEQPSVMTLYFSRVDSEGHENGPTSDSVATALREVDGFIQQLLDGLSERNVSDAVNLIITSDHGMSPTSRDRAIVLDDYIDLEDVHLVDVNPVAMMTPKEGVSADSLVAALSEAPHLSAYHRSDLPDTLHFQNHRRIPSVLALADDRWSITTQDYIEENPEALNGGAHGYDMRYDNMHTLLIAKGPAFRSSSTVDQLSTLHLYELMAALLKVDPAPNDGRLEAARPLLAPTSTPAVQ